MVEILKTNTTKRKRLDYKNYHHRQFILHYTPKNISEYCDFSEETNFFIEMDKKLSDGVYLSDDSIDEIRLNGGDGADIKFLASKEKYIHIMEIMDMEFDEEDFD